MSKKVPLKLKNPYEQSSSPIIQQQNEEYSFLFQEQENHQIVMQQHAIAEYDYSFSKVEVNQNCQMEELSEVYSQTNSRAHTVFPTELSGVHHKYLNEESCPLSKKVFKTEVKSKNPKKVHASIKFSKKGAEKQQELNIKIDPFSQGFSSLQIDSQSLLNSLTCKTEFSEEQKTDLFSQLGLKQPKTLGKGRSKRDFEAIQSFLARGELPQQFVNDFIQLLSKCLRVYKL